jgi:hypothetical protein
MSILVAQIPDNYKNKAFLLEQIQAAQELLQPNSCFLQRLHKIKKISIQNVLITGQQIFQAFQHQSRVHIETYCSRNDFREALGYIKEGGYIGVWEPVIHDNCCRLAYCSEEEVLATVIHGVVLAVLVQSHEGFFSRSGDMLDYQLTDIMDSTELVIGDAREYGAFILQHEGSGKYTGPEVSRDVFYKVVLKEVKRNNFDCCFPFC